MWPRGLFTSAALPFGACTNEGDVCTMSAEWVGPCPIESTARGPLDLFIGIWTCTIDDSGPSGTLWSCDVPDAATDGG